MVPCDFFAEVGAGKDAEDDEGDGFLHDFELCGGEAALVADAVGGDLEAVFEEGDSPGDQDDFPTSRLFQI